mmetsp:Transcript_44773/g.88630  ORF Transcript_44773/g.88630 Transcript_44773/m.88630 type:complete len:111 (-) Transcript_44773:175-507(-)
METTKGAELYIIKTGEAMKKTETKKDWKDFLPPGGSATKTTSTSGAGSAETDMGKPNGDDGSAKKDQNGFLPPGASETKTSSTSRAGSEETDMGKPSGDDSSATTKTSTS